MKNEKQKKLRRLLQRNCVAVLLPAIVIFVLVFIIIREFPVMNYIACHSVESLDEMQEWYHKKYYNISITIPELKYSGYDYYEDKKRAGAYYYTFMDDTCMFFLIRTNQPETILEDVTIRGKMLENSPGLDTVKNEFSKELGLDYESLNAFVNPIMISEIDYPYLEILLVCMVLILPYIVATITIVLSVLWLIQPYRHPSTRQLSEFGERRMVYDEIESQLRNALIQHEDNYYITEEYLVIHNWYSTDFIRIEYIRYISKHIVAKQNGKKQVYRLTMSNPEKMFYEKDFVNEKIANEIMETLVRLNPQIDNRAITVFNLAVQDGIQEVNTENSEAEKEEE